MKISNARIRRESRTVAVMIAHYCHNNHSTVALCMQCNELLEYSRKRLDKCPFGEGKTVCTKCPVHCYRQEMRQKIRTVMRYSGPRMLYKHPVIVIQHLIDGWRENPSNENRLYEK